MGAPPDIDTPLGRGGGGTGGTGAEFWDKDSFGAKAGGGGGGGAEDVRVEVEAGPEH